MNVHRPDRPDCHFSVRWARLGRSAGRNTLLLQPTGIFQLDCSTPCPPLPAGLSGIKLGPAQPIWVQPEFSCGRKCLGRKAKSGHTQAYDASCRFFYVHFPVSNVFRHIVSCEFFVYIFYVDFSYILIFSCRIWRVFV